MTHDTDWPASSPHSGEQPSRIEADRLAWCIRYLADEARRGGFTETAEALEAAVPVADSDRTCKNMVEAP